MVCCSNELFFLVTLLTQVRPLIAVEGLIVRRMNLSVKGGDYHNGSMESIYTSPQLKLSTVRFSPEIEGTEQCSACVRVQARINVTGNLNEKLEINFQSKDGSRTINIKRQKEDWLRWWERFPGVSKGKTKIKLPGDGPLIVWDLVFDCLQYEAGQEIRVSLSANPKEIKRYIVQDVCPDPVPRYNLSVNPLSKSITVTVDKGQRVHTVLCYKTTNVECHKFSSTIIDPSKSQSAVLSFPFQLPCVCLQMYYAYLDASRNTYCPFLKGSLSAGSDVWLSSEAILYGDTGSSLHWSSKCPPAYLQPTASLCWRNVGGTQRCTPILNSTLEMTVGRLKLIYNMSAVDKHPQMCVLFSFHGSQHVQCPFKETSRWDAYVGPGWRSLHIYLSTTIPAVFSAQLCILEKRACISTGPVYSIRMGEGAREKHLTVPLPVLTDGLCLKVWKSDPAQLGKRVLCTDYSHRRYGLLIVAALTLLLTMAMLGRCIHYMTKRTVAGWLSIQRPVLMVCSSEQSAHVSAVCALASILQGELCAAVRMALWAQSSGGRQNEVGDGSEAGPGPGSGAAVTELGPVPWLYGQWEAVQAAGGKVLIIWSPEANSSYNCWEKERTGLERQEGKVGKGKTEKARAGIRVGEAGGEESSGMVYEQGAKQEPSPVTGPVFRAALSCLRGAMQKGGRKHGCILVYFHGFCHNRDIPKDLRGVPRYCLPRDFRGLIQELGGLADETGGTIYKNHCFPRLLSKTVSLWLARRLSHRLTTWLPKQQTSSKRKKLLRKTFAQELVSENEPLSRVIIE